MAGISRYPPPTRRNVGSFTPSWRDTGPYAGFWTRAAAGAIDFGIFLGIYLIWVVLTFLIVSGVSFYNPLGAMGASIVWFVLSLMVVIALAISGWVLMALRGQTLGKMAVGLKVVDDAGGPPGFAVSLVRSYFKWVGLYMLFLGSVVIAWDREKQGFHDHIAHTHVVRSR